MTKTLILMRHAKSSWDHAGPDIDRPLNARGQAAAPLLGAHLTALKLRVDDVLCSSALRTQETAARLNMPLPMFTPIQALYLAPPRVLLEQLKQARGDTVLLIAHNPGIADFAQSICEIPPKHPRFDDYPTGSTLVCTFSAASWADVEWHSATATSFVTPKDLVSPSSF